MVFISNRLFLSCDTFVSQHNTQFPADTSCGYVRFAINTEPLGASVKNDTADNLLLKDRKRKTIK